MRSRYKILMFVDQVNSTGDTLGRTQAEIAEVSRRRTAYTRRGSHPSSTAGLAGPCETEAAFPFPWSRMQCSPCGLRLPRRTPVGVPSHLGPTANLELVCRRARPYAMRTEHNPLSIRSGFARAASG